MRKIGNRVHRYYWLNGSVGSSDSAGSWLFWSSEKITTINYLKEVCVKTMFLTKSLVWPHDFCFPWSQSEEHYHLGNLIFSPPSSDRLFDANPFCPLSGMEKVKLIPQLTTIHHSVRSWTRKGLISHTCPDACSTSHTVELLPTSIPCMKNTVYLHSLFESRKY